MWIFASNSVLSIVASRRNGFLLVRARRRGDIERLFPDAEVTESEHRDYRFRAHIPRRIVAEKIAECLSKINYRNFKGSVRDSKRHSAYLAVWGVMAAWQDSLAKQEGQK